MNLQGTKVNLRRPQMVDLDLIFKWENDPLNWLVSNTVAPYSKEEIEKFIEQEHDLYSDQQMRWMIEDKDNAVIGCVDLYDFDPKNQRVGLGILIDDPYRGKGLGQDALKVVVQFCFDKAEVRTIHAEILENNPSSHRLFEAIGFERNGTKKDWIWDGTRFLDQFFYQLSNPK